MPNEDKTLNGNNSIESEIEKLLIENARLKARLNRIETLFENTTIGIYQTTPSGEVTEANLPLIKMLGYDSLEDMQTHNLEQDELIEQRDRNIFKDKLKKNGFIIGHETKWIKKNGEPIYIRESARTIEDSKGNVIFYEGTVEDISERKLKEIEIINSEEKYRKLIELLPNGLVIHKDSKIVYVNEVIVKTMKYKDKSYFVGQNIYDFVHPDYHNLAKSRLKKVIGKDEVVDTTEEIFIASDGQLIYVEVSAFPFELNGEKHIVSLVTDISERKKAENELRLSEITYRGMLNSITEAIFIQNIDGSFIDVNKAAETVYGYEHNFFIGRYPSELSAGEINNFNEIRDKISLAYDGIAQKLDFWGRKVDGTVFKSEVNLSSGLYFGKKVVVAVVRDLTDRILAEQKLIESEKKYRDLINFAVGGILIGSPEGIITEANDHMCTLLGREKNDIIGRHISSGFFTKESLEKSPLLFHKLIEGHTIINQRDIIQPNGMLVPIEMHTKMMPDNSYQSIYHDISQRKIAEQKILEAKEIAEKLNLHKEALLKAMPDILFTFNNEGVIIDFYSNISDLLLTSPQNFMNKGIAEVLPAELAESTKVNIKNVLRTGKMSKYTYVLNVAGKNMHFDARMVYLNEITVLAVVRDITERMQLIDELENAKVKAEESDRLKSAFLANMSHEIRTPMNAILGFTDLLKDEVTRDEKIEYLEIIENSCNQLLIILNDIIEISKIEAGIVTKKLDTFNLKELLNDVYSEMQGLIIKERNVDLNLDNNSGSINLICVSDRIKLKQIFTNLISNALKFTEHGFVEFGYNAISDTYIEFYVKDTGVGIPESELEKIFNRFVQVDNKLSISTSGSGLGLSICKAYSEILGGNLRVESELEKGSTFYFSFPMISYS